MLSIRGNFRETSNFTRYGDIQNYECIRAGIVNLLGEADSWASLTAIMGAADYAACSMPQTSCHAWKARVCSVL